MSRSQGLPVKPLHETARHVVRVELRSGVLYWGIMIEGDDNWNCQLWNIICTAKELLESVTTGVCFCPTKLSKVYAAEECANVQAS